jgi:hypothetical protein
MKNASSRKDTRMKKRLICSTILFFLAFSVTANSSYWESSDIELASISPKAGSDHGRLLFRFDLPAQLNDCTIDYAELVFAATADTGSGRICLMGAFPVTKSWDSANLSWSDGWTNSGGDYADSRYSTALIRSSTNRLTRMDITDIVQMWVDSTLVNHGLILMPLEDPDRFLKLHTTTDLGPGVKAKVRLFYTHEDPE